MTVLELIEALGELDLNAQVFLCPDVSAVSGAEQCPGDQYLDAYVVLHGRCGGRGLTIQEAIDAVRVEHRESLDLLADM